MISGFDMAQCGQVMTDSVMTGSLMVLYLKRFQ
jgi:hypothetical protein